MKFLLFAVCYLLAFPAWPNVVERLQQQAALQDLATAPYWLALLHQEGVNTRSAIVDPDFFLASAADAGAELNATLAALLLPVSGDVNAHAQCRFIARSHWLQQQLPELKHQLATVSCPLFDDWSDQQQIGSVSAIFASGYLGNPASFYGHILLKFNSASDKRALLQQQNINFGAEVPTAENPLLYIAKGLAGGYNAVFSYGDFYRNIHTYGETELRDLWEYQLALTDAEVKQLLYHAWELIGRDYVYYFLRENCAFRMAELLELVVGRELISRRKPYAMPISVFHRLAEVEHHGQPLVSKITQHPSRQKRLHAGYQQSSPDLQNAVAWLVANNYQLAGAVFQQLTVAERIQVLEILFDYIEFLKVEADTPELTKIKNQLLQARLQLPAAKPTSLTLNDNAPHRNTYPSLIQVAITDTENSVAYDLRFRATYYDLLTANRDPGVFSALAMFDVQVRLQQGRLALQRFELLNIENMNLSHTGLAGDGGLAWKINLGYLPEDLVCPDCQQLQLTAGLGKALPLGTGILYLMQDGRLHQDKVQTGWLSADSRLGTVFDVLPYWRLQAEVGYRSYLNAERDNFFWYRLQQRFATSQRWDWRLTVERQRSTELRLAYSYYW